MSIFSSRFELSTFWHWWGVLLPNGLFFHTLPPPYWDILRDHTAINWSTWWNFQTPPHITCSAYTTRDCRHLSSLTLTLSQQLPESSDHEQSLSLWKIPRLGAFVSPSLLMSLLNSSSRCIYINFVSVHIWSHYHLLRLYSVHLITLAVWPSVWLCFNSFKLLCWSSDFYVVVSVFRRIEYMIVILQVFSKLHWSRWYGIVCGSAMFIWTTASGEFGTWM